MVDNRIPTRFWPGTMDHTTLTEHCQDWNQHLCVDEDKRLVQNVALTGGRSKNGYTYSDAALQEAVALYDGKPVFLDHARNRNRPQERSTRDLVGSIINPRYVEHRIRGDIRVLDTESGHTFLKLLELNAPGVGMSHVVQARRSADGATVQEIADVISVDVVVNPATTSTFRESDDTDKRVETDDEQSLQLREQVAELERECDELQRRNAQLQETVDRHQRRLDVRQLVSECRIPDSVVTDFFIQQLESAPDSQTRRQMIEDRLSIISRSGERQPIVLSRIRESTSPQAPADDSFIQAIRSRS